MTKAGINVDLITERKATYWMRSILLRLSLKRTLSSRHLKYWESRPNGENQSHWLEAFENVVQT